MRARSSTSSRAAKSPSTLFPDHDHLEAIHEASLNHARREHERVRTAAEEAYRNYLHLQEQEKVAASHRRELERIELAKRQALLAAEQAEIERLNNELKVEKEARERRRIEAIRAEERRQLEIARAEDARKLKEADEAREIERRLAAENAKAKQAPALPQGVPTATTSNAAELIPIGPSHQPITSATATIAPTQKANLHTSQPPYKLVPGADRLVEIHKSLKELRKNLDIEAKRVKLLKTQMGDGRREIRKSVGQLTEGGAGTNKQPLEKILSCLTAAKNDTSGPQIDPLPYLIQGSISTQTNDSSNTGGTVPAILIYLLNIFSKCAIRQLVDEAGLKSKTANPIGVIVATIFAKPDFQWFGSSFIDILMAKFRITCPVLWGVRGNEATEEGRARIGWWKENDVWVPEQTHLFRMTGLAAGYAAIALRDFSKSKMQNPYPPSNYWISLAAIVSTPPAEASATQFTVLKSMIYRYEARFIKAYGNAGKAALQVALVDFPAQQQGRSGEANALLTLAEQEGKENGLFFSFPSWWK